MIHGAVIGLQFDEQFTPVPMGVAGLAGYSNQKKMQALHDSGMLSAKSVAHGAAMRTNRGIAKRVGAHPRAVISRGRACTARNEQGGSGAVFDAAAVFVNVKGVSAR